MKPYHQFVVVSSCLLCTIASVAATELPPAQRSGVAYTTPTVSVLVPAADPDYVDIFKRYDVGFNSGRGMSDADNTNGQLAWLQSYQMLAYMRMYRATSYTKWLNSLASQFARVLECRDDKLGRKDVHAGVPLKGWGTSSYDKAGWHVFVVHTGMICQGPVEFIKAVNNNPVLQNDYGATATLFLAEIEAIVADADKSFKTNEAGEGWYEDASMGIVPLNMSNAMGSVLVELYQITGKAEYREKARALARYFKNSLRDAGNGTVNWSYWPKTSKDKIDRGEDISHAALNVDFAARCADIGVVFDDSDMKHFAQTWLKVVRKRDGTWADHVDGSIGSKPGAYIPQAPGRWLSISRHLKGELRTEFVADVERAFVGQEINLPSRAVGVAGLALWGE